MKSSIPGLTILLTTVLIANTWQVCQAAQPIYTNKTHFRIPYRYDAAEMQRLNAQKIQLFTSTNQGVHWNLAQSVTPDAGNFDFQAPTDGEFWFSVKTLDGTQQLHPAGQFEPGLKVIVDTEPPRFEMNLRQLAAGRVELTWNANDPHLDANRLMLEYVETGAPNWKPLQTQRTAQGNHTWTVPQGGMIAVRGTIGDKAANIARAQQQVQVAPGTPGQTVTPDFSQPIAGGEGNLMASNTPLPSLNPSLNFGNHGNQQYNSNSVPQPVLPGMNSSTLSAQQNSMNQTSPQTNSIAAGRHRVVNSHNFNIGYKIDDIGPSGVSDVELFITQNNGAKWWKYGNDTDKASPVEIQVPTDGVYGFSIRVHSGAGLTTAAPLTGEKPEIVVVVDNTPPTAQLLPIQRGTGSDANKLAIKWVVADQNADPRPVSLFYSAAPNGPWEPISGWQSNTGQYLWTVGPGLPSRLYIKMTARDAAGNTTHVQTPQPLVIDLSRPTARIVDVAPSGRRIE